MAPPKAGPFALWLGLPPPSTNRKEPGLAWSASVPPGNMSLSFLPQTRLAQHHTIRVGDPTLPTQSALRQIFFRVC